MQTLVWIVRFVVVVILVWFAARNSDAVKLRGFLDQTWEAPLVFVLLVVFVAGVVIGLLAWVPTVVRQRREIGRLRKAAEPRAPSAALPVAPAAEPPHGI
jgi:putative membrane protein